MRQYRDGCWGGLVLRRLLNSIDYDHVSGCFGGFEFQAQLLRRVGFVGGLTRPENWAWVPLRFEHCDLDSSQLPIPGRLDPACTNQSKKLCGLSEQHGLFPTRDATP